MIRLLRPALFASLLTIYACPPATDNSASQASARDSTALLSELPKDEGRDLRAPYELWVATFAADEGDYGSGPRIVIITNDRSSAIVYVRGTRTALTRTNPTGPDRCDTGRRLEDRFESSGVILTMKLTTSPGEEACWVQGTVTVTVGDQTATFRVKGASGI